MIRPIDMKTAAMLIVAPAGSLGLTSAVHAHHSFAMYDNSKDVALDGIVKDWRWANPHGGITLVVMQNGKPVEYAIELSSLNVMSRQGWNRKSLKVGDRLKVIMHPLKDGSNGGSFAKAVKADGTILQSPAPK